MIDLTLTKTEVTFLKPIVGLGLSVHSGTHEISLGPNLVNVTQGLVHHQVPLANVHFIKRTHVEVEVQEVVVPIETPKEKPKRKSRTRKKAAA